MVFAGGYSLFDPDQITSSGYGQAVSDEKDTIVLPKFCEPLFFSPSYYFENTVDDYKIHHTSTSKEKLTLFNLGYKYEDFLRILSRLCNQILLKDMLMHETLRKSGAEAEFILTKMARNCKKGDVNRDYMKLQ